MAGFYPILAAIIIAIGFYANHSFERLIDHYATRHRYNPRQRAVTSRWVEIQTARRHHDDQLEALYTHWLCEGLRMANMTSIQISKAA